MLTIKEFLGRREAARYLGISLNTLVNWENKKKIKFSINPVNKRRLYKKDDLFNFLKSLN